MRMTKEDKRTSITWNNADSIVTCSTFDRKLINRLNKLIDSGNEYISQDSDGISGEKVYNFPKSWLKVNPPRQVDETRRAAMSERAKKMMNERWNSRD